MMNTILLMAPSGKQGDMGLMSMLPLLGMVLVLYFFMLRPQIKKAKLQKEFAASIAEGDNIITIAGIHGKITRMNEDGTIMVEINKSNVVKMERSAISMEMTQAMIAKNKSAK